MAVPIFDINKLPTNLRVDVHLAERPGVPDGRAIEISKKNIAAELARKIVEDRRFFEFDSAVGVTRIRGHVLVMTTDEYSQTISKVFNMGVCSGKGMLQSEEY